MKLTGKNGLRTAAVLAAVTAMIGVSALPAAAHVTVNPKEATVGGYARLNFRVPNESDSESTVKVEVAFPEDAPFASVSVKPSAGWTVATEKRKLSKPIKNHDSEITEAVSKITWTADGSAAVKPGQFQEFDLSVGPVPDVKQIIFKALQTYSDGTIVRWIDEPKEGAEVEHPAPVLKVVKAAAAAAPAPAAKEESGEGSGVSWAIALGAVALLVSLAALGLSLRRPAPPAG
ncbi:YcnI family copper-binding membrane protein [Rhizocola hellebori]|nr:YcnI family protein [Rhizocola hellebori]